MTVIVTMLTTRMGEDGTFWESGTTHEASDNFAKHLVQFQWATARFDETTGYTTARAFVTADGEYQLLDHRGRVVALNQMMQGVNLIAGFGDSLSSAARNTTVAAGGIYYKAGGYLSWVQALSMGKLWLPVVARVATGPVVTELLNYAKGVSGQTTVDMLARLTDITNLNPRPRFVFVLAGTNDVAGNDTYTDSVETIFNRWMTIVEAFRAVGIIVCCITLLPRGNGSSATPWNLGFSAAQVATARGKLLQINQLIRAYCAITPGTILIDPWRRLVNWSSTTSDATAGLTSSSDYIHPNDLGAYAIGEEARVAMAPFLTQGEVQSFAGAGDVYSATDNPYGSMIDGSFITGTGGTATSPYTTVGGVPTGWTFNRLSGAGSSSGVVEKRARSDSKAGNECFITYTGGAGGPDAFRGYVGTGSIASGNFAAEDAWYAQCDVSVIATGAYAAPNINARQNSVDIYALLKTDVDVPGTYSVTLRTPLIVQSAAAAVNFWHLDTIGTVCSAVVNRRDPCVRKYNPSLPGAVVW